MNEVDVIAQIGDLKDIDYRNTLAIATLIELLIEKKVFTRQEFRRKSYQLDRLSDEVDKENRAGI